MQLQDYTNKEMPIGAEGICNGRPVRCCATPHIVNICDKCAFSAIFVSECPPCRSWQRSDREEAYYPLLVQYDIDSPQL